MVSELVESRQSRVLDGVEAEHWLARLGLKPEHFHRAARHGNDQRARCTALHPSSFPGQVMWAETTRQLRAQLIAMQKGWKPGRSSNYETIFMLDRRIAIAVVGGDGFTGESGYPDPSTARRRGPVTSERVARNRAGQLTFSIPGIHEPATSDDECETWFFLMNARNDTLFSELSLPVSMGKNRRISEWAKRVIMPPLPLSGVVTPIAPQDEDGPDVTVKRKA